MLHFTQLLTAPGVRLGLTGIAPVAYTETTTMLYVLLWIVHVIVCLFLIIVVLLQSGKAADLAGAFGGQGSQTAFGPRGSATLLSKATTFSAILFMVTSMSLSIMASKNAGLGTSVLESAPRPGVPTKSTPVQSAPLPVPVQTARAGSQQPSIPAPPAPAKK